MVEVRKIILFILFFLTVFAFKSKAVMATSGTSCCGAYNTYMFGQEVYHPSSDGLSCTSTFSPAWIRDLLNSFSACGTTSANNPFLLFFCNIPNNFGGLPVRCDGAERCDLSTNTCNLPQNVIVSEIQDPVCPKGYSDITTISPFSYLGMLSTGYDPNTMGRACCKADFLNTVISPLKCFLDPKTNMVLGTNCADSRFSYRNVKLPDGTVVNKCVKVKSFFWQALSCNGTAGVDTAIGCVPTGNLTDFLKFVLKFALFASGGIILLMTIATGYTVLTSQGNPEKLQGAKENIVALLSGLALIAFSLILLQVIGADILGLPTF